MDEAEVIKIVMVGDSGVGKSSILLRFVEDSFTDFFIATTGVDFKTKKFSLDGKDYTLELWDTAGQERFRTITTSYYRGAKGVILVYDVTDPMSFNNARQWLIEIERYAVGPVKMLIGNKADLDNKKQVAAEDGQEFAGEYDLPFLEASAKDGTNVEQVFDTLLKKIISQLEVMKAAEADQRNRNNSNYASSHGGGSSSGNNVSQPVIVRAQDGKDKKPPGRRCLV